MTNTMKIFLMLIKRSYNIYRTSAAVLGDVKNAVLLPGGLRTGIASNDVIQSKLVYKPKIDYKNISSRRKDKTLLQKLSEYAPQKTYVDSYGKFDTPMKIL